MFDDLTILNATMATAKVQTLQARFLPTANYFCELYHGVITARKSAGFSRRAMLYIKIVTLHHLCMLFFSRFCSLSVSLGFVNGGMPLFRGSLLSNLYPLEFFFFFNGCPLPPVREEAQLPPLYQVMLTVTLEEDQLPSRHPVIVISF